MIITSYNSDGSIQETKTIDSEIPEYVERYDELHSFLNITAQEVEIVNSKTRSFRKTSLLKRLTIAIQHDFKNFTEAYNMDMELLMMDLESYMYNAESNPDIITGDKILSSILRVYGYHSKNKFENGIRSNEFFSEESCTQKEFLIYINKVECQRTDEKGNVVSGSWINVLFYHALKSAVNVRLRYDDVEIGTQFFISLQNLINRYYYSLKNMERVVSWMPDELKHQMYVLSAFIKKVDANRLFDFNESLFYTKVINALFIMKEEKRSDLYRLMAVILNSNQSLLQGGHCLHFSEKKLPEIDEKTYEINFYGCMKRIEKCYSVTENEILTLRLPKENNLLASLQNLLTTIYEQYIEMYHTKWEGNVKTDANSFFGKQYSYQEDWNAFYNHEVEKYRPTNISSDKLFEPQDCFFYLLCDNIYPDNELMFTKDVVADLLELLIEHPSDSQIGLYECMFKMNYIKKHICLENPADSAVEKAMKYIGCLFEPDCKLVRLYYRVHIKQLIVQIFSLPAVKKRMIQVKPNGFTGGFNLKLVYNVLGLLHDKENTIISIITCGSGKLDDFIKNYAIDKGFIKKMGEKKSYITKTDEICDVLEDITNIRDSFVKKILGDKKLL